MSELFDLLLNSVFNSRNCPLAFAKKNKTNIRIKKQFDSLFTVWIEFFKWQI